MRRVRRLNRVSGACLAIAAGALAVLACGSGPAWSQDARVDIDAYDIDGNTLLDQAAIETAVYSFLGPQRRREDVESARAALERAYHDKGYQSVVVEIPPQTVNEGIVRLHVLETSVGRLRVTGADYFSPEDIRRGAPSLREGATPNLAQAQKELSDLNRLGDRQITPLLKPGRVPGTLDVELQVSDKLPLHGSVEVNNDHARDTPELRSAGTLSYGNLWQRGHTISMTYSVAPQDRTAGEIFAGSYLAPVWGTPWNLLLYGYNSNSAVSTLGGANVLGKGHAVGLRGLRQLPGFGTYSQSMTFGMDFKHFDQAISVGGAGIPPVAINYWPVTASYSLQNGDDNRGMRLSVAAIAGIRGLGDNTAVFLNNRFRARPDFIRLTGEFSYRRPVGHGFQMLTKVNGQLADQPLLAGEQFSAGGLTSVRGYLQSEAVGDDGVAASYELISPRIVLQSTLVSDWRFYAFVDAAAARVLHPTPGQTSVLELYSVGLGTRFEISKRLRGDLGVAIPTQTTDSTDAGKARAIFNLKSEF